MSAPARSSPAPAVETHALGRRYGAVTALHDVALRIEPGHYFVLLGPSGGGKTTLLRLLGGFVRPSTGRVHLHGEDVTDLPPDRRPTSMVFQGYALFPHMNVEDNVGFGLRLQGLRRRELRARVERMLEIVGLAGLNARMPHELSGGQQQRVQLARSLVLERDILLLDEPLAALDEKLRKEMCLELKRIQEQVGITFVHVTHNQEEAMTVADRIGVIAEGRLIEEGGPREIYEQPRRRFTAGFVGDAHLFTGMVREAVGGRLAIDIGFAGIRALADDRSPRPGDRVWVSVRSERLRIEPAGGGERGRGEGDEPCAQSDESVPARYERPVYLGLTTADVVVLPDGSRVNVRRLSASGPGPALEPGAEIRLAWRLEDARLHTG